ncbi:MAG: CD3324 family protein [Clostridiales bacterium]
MKYRNAKIILPEDLLNKLQKYVQGEIIYVPCNNIGRARWGEVNGTRKKYKIRNREIKLLYKSGYSINEIADKYFLSEHSIRKIVSNRIVEEEKKLTINS